MIIPEEYVNNFYSAVESNGFVTSGDCKYDPGSMLKRSY